MSRIVYPGPHHHGVPGPGWVSAVFLVVGSVVIVGAVVWILLGGRNKRD